MDSKHGTDPSPLYGALRRCKRYEIQTQLPIAIARAITYIDGDKGELLYRGYPIEQLAASSNYLEVCYLLLYGADGRV